MKAIPYHLELLEPVLIAQMASGEENSAIGLPFIPGSVVRGALIARYLDTHPTDDLAVEAQARQWFLDGTVCFLNAYPSYGDERTRMLPTPASWFTEKDDARFENTLLRDWAVDPTQRLEQPKPPQNAEFCHLLYPDSDEDEEDEDEFIERRPEKAVCYSPLRHVNVHIAVVEPNRRGKGENTVYRYEALAANQVFSGVIIAPDEVDLIGLYDLLHSMPELFIGKAQSAGYGRVRLKVDPIVTGWEEYSPGDPPDSGEIIVTLLSDTLVRGPGGQINGDLDAALAKLLGLPSLKAQRRYYSMGLVGGFNRKWGLPLPQAWALRAGSVFVYEAGAFDPEELRHKVALGIGERRAEGFGRIAVNWHTALTVKRQKMPPVRRLLPDLSPESQKLAQKMAQRRLRQLLERGLVDYWSRVEFKRLPSRTQLSRVRNAVQQAMVNVDGISSGEEKNPVKEHLKSLNRAKSELQQARIDGVSMSKWILERLDSLDVEQLLLQGESLPQIAGQTATLDEKTKLIYTLRLIDGVMQKASRLKEAR